MLYPQNGDRIVAIDIVTSIHPSLGIVALRYDRLLFNSLRYKYVRQP